MARALPIPPSGFDDLSAEEKVDYVQSLWDRIVEHPENVQVPTWHQQVIAERLAAHSSDTESARPWNEVREEIAAKLKDNRKEGQPKAPQALPACETKSLRVGERKRGGEN